MGRSAGCLNWRVCTGLLRQSFFTCKSEHWWPAQLCVWITTFSCYLYKSIYWLLQWVRPLCRCRTLQTTKITKPMEILKMQRISSEKSSGSGRKRAIETTGYSELRRSCSTVQGVQFSRSMSVSEEGEPIPLALLKCKNCSCWQSLVLRRCLCALLQVLCIKNEAEDYRLRH